MRKSTQKQRNFITSLVARVGVEEAFKAGALTIDQAHNQGRDRDVKPFRSPREVAQHCNSIEAASKAITALKELV